MMNIKGIFAVSLIAMVAMVAGAHTSNAVAAIASQGYVDQQVGSKLSSISGSTTGSGNVVTSVSASGSTVSAAKDITAEETKNKVTSANYDDNVSNDTKYPTVKAVADAIDDVEKKIPAAIKVDSALSSTSTNPVQNKVINTALSGKVTIAQGSGAANKAVITNSSGNIITGQIASGMIADDAVTSAKLAAGAVDANALAAGAVTSAKIADDAVTTAKLAAGAVANDNLANSAVTSAKIADDAVTSAKLAAGAVDTNALAAGAVTSAKIADGTIPTVNNATLTIKKNGTSVGTFTANASANKEIDITVPTTTSQLTNNSGFITADDLPVATANTLGGVKSGGDITVDTSGAVTVNSASRADSATTATNAKTAATDAEGNNIILTYATKSQITALDSTSEGTGAVVTNVSQKDGKVSVTKGNVQIPVGSATATTYATIWVQ